MASAEEMRSFEFDYVGMTNIEVIREMRDIQMAKERMEAELAGLNKRFDYLRLNEVPKRMEGEGVTSMKIDGIGRVTLTGDMYASIKSDKKEEAYQWLGDTGHGDIIKPTINASSLKAMLKALLQKGEEVPEDLFNVTPFTRASITKA